MATRAETSDELAFVDGLGQAELVRAGEVTPVELVEAAVGRIERLDTQLNAVVIEMFEMALDAARDTAPQGPFTGVPYLLKDLAVEYAGVRFTEGSRFLRDNVSTHDQELVRRLRGAGLIVVGKTNTPEFGLWPTCENDLFGATRNPWDTSRTPGGSSGGSAAAVAAGMVAMGYGNDAGGSIRYPASCCGLFGLKPTRGRLPWGPEYGDVMSGFAVEHALTRMLAVQELQRASRDVARFLCDHDVWLTPTLSQPPVAVGALRGDGIAEVGGKVAAFLGFPASVANFTGNPAISVPLYWNGEGLPIGVHFLGRFGDEATLLRLASQLEQARPWAQRRPPVSA